MNIVLAATAATLFGYGTYLILQRSLTRTVIGLAMIAHGANLLLLLAGGRGGEPPFVVDTGAPAGASDPLAQALVLTAIVIGFGVSGFLLAVAYRSWWFTRDDEVEDDVEDRRIARLGSDEAAS